MEGLGAAKMALTFAFYSPTIIAVEEARCPAQPRGSRASGDGGKD